MKNLGQLLEENHTKRQVLTGMEAEVSAKIKLLTNRVKSQNITKEELLSEITKLYREMKNHHYSQLELALEETQILIKSIAIWEA